MVKKTFFGSVAALALASWATAQTVASGSYNSAMPNGADQVRIVPGYAVARGSRFGPVLRQFNPKQITKEFDFGSGHYAYFSDHQVDAFGNVYAVGTYGGGGTPSQLLVLKLDSAMNVAWQQIVALPDAVTGPKLAVSVDRTRIYASFQAASNGYAGYVTLDSAGTLQGNYVEFPGPGRTGINAVDIRAVGTETLLTTEETISDESYVEFTLLRADRFTERRFEHRPLTGRGPDNRRGQWHFRALGLTGVTSDPTMPLDRIVFTASDSLATGADTMSRLTCLVPARIRSVDTFSESWHQNDGGAFRGERTETRLAVSGNRVAWMGRYDRLGGSGPLYQPYLMNAYDAVTGDRQWYRSLTAAPDDTTANREAAMGGLTFDPDDSLRAFSTEQHGGVYTVRCYRFAGWTGDCTVARLTPGFYFRNPYDPRGSIGLIGASNIILGLSDGWVTARRLF